MIFFKLIGSKFHSLLPLCSMHFSNFRIRFTYCKSKSRMFVVYHNYGQIRFCQNIYGRWREFGFGKTSISS